MIEFMRDYWWLAGLMAAVIVVVTHALLVKLIASTDTRPRDKD